MTSVFTCILTLMTEFIQCISEETKLLWSMKRGFNSLLASVYISKQFLLDVELFSFSLTHLSVQDCLPGRPLLINGTLLHLLHRHLILSVQQLQTSAHKHTAEIITRRFPVSGGDSLSVKWCELHLFLSKTVIWATNVVSPSSLIEVLLLFLFTTSSVKSATHDKVTCHPALPHSAEEEEASDWSEHPDQWPQQAKRFTLSRKTQS